MFWNILGKNPVREGVQDLRQDRSQDSSANCRVSFKCQNPPFWKGAREVSTEQARTNGDLREAACHRFDDRFHKNYGKGFDCCSRGSRQTDAVANAIDRQRLLRPGLRGGHQ